jgi:hypothetical protein
MTPQKRLEMKKCLMQFAKRVAEGGQNIHD